MATQGFGERLRGLRKTLGVSQERLAELAEMDRSHLSKIENGKIDIPSADVQRRLAAAFGISTSEMIGRMGYTQGERSAVEDDAAVALARATQHWNNRQRQLLWQYIEAVDAAMDATNPSDDDGEKPDQPDHSGELFTGT